MMGATFKYAAPLAGSLGYSVEDVAVAIGLMANAGIKGEQAGTALSKSVSLAFTIARNPDIASCPARDAAYCAFSSSVKFTNDSNDDFQKFFGRVGDISVREV